MKKVLSLVLVLAMVLGMMPVFAAGETGADQLYKYGFIAGNNGDLMVDKELTRAEMAVLVAEMNGLKEEAANYAAPANFGDVEAGKWYTPYVAYGQANGWWAGYPDGTFKPEIGMSGQEFANVLMNALKYDTTWNTVVADAAAIGITVKTTNFTRGAAFDAMWAAVNMPIKGEEVALGVKLGRLESAMVTTGPLAVDTVTANTAKSFEVKFKNVVADTTKVTFDVKRETTKATVTVAWNEAKTVATLASTAKLSEGNYEIVVNDATGTAPVALGTFKVTIEKEKIAKVEFASDVLQRFSNTKGFAKYKVLNQYGENITDSSLGRGMTWNASIGSLTNDYKTGTIIVTQGDESVYNSQLRSFNTFVFTLQDTSSRFVESKTLTVSDTAAAIGEVKINGIVNEKGEAVNFVYSKSKTYYIDYTALDPNGDELNAYKILKETVNGAKILDFNGGAGYFKIEEEDKDGVMKYKIVFDATTAPTYDLNLTIMATSSQGGKSGTFNVTLQKELSLEKFVLLAPVETVSSGKDIEIPFEAFDQNGVVAKDFEDLDNKLTFTAPGGSNVRFVRQSDGTAKLMGTFINSNTKDGVTQYLSSTVKQATTSSFSQISFVVKMAALPDTIKSLSHAKAYTTDSSWNRRISNFSIMDQFDNKMNLRNDKDYTLYAVRITTPNDKIINLGVGSAPAASSATGTSKSVVISGEQKVYFAGGTEYSSVTLTYELVKVAAKNSTTVVGAAIDSSTATAYNVDPKDITSAVVEGVEGQKVFMLKKDDRFTEVKVEPDLWGKTSDGTLVRLPASMDLGYTVSDARFDSAAAKGGKIKTLKDGDFGSSDSVTASVTGMINGINGVYTDVKNIIASSELPKATKVYVDYDNGALRDGFFSQSTDVVTISATNLASIFNGNTSLDGNSAVAAKINFLVNTQYGDDNGVVDQFTVSVIKGDATAASFNAAEVTVGTVKIPVGAALTITGSKLATGDKIQVTAISGGKSQAVMFEISGL